MPEYLTIILSFLATALFLKWKYKIKLYRSVKEGAVLISTTFILFIAWDYLGVWRRHWIFPGPGLLGIKIGILPIEEFVLFLVLPFFGLTLYKTFEKIFHGRD